MPRVLVTGATGMIGSYLCERLVGDGWTVRALVRDPDAARWLSAPRVELVAGDVMDRPSIERAARGCDAVVHAAALITPRGGWERFRSTNVEGTRNVVAAAAAGGGMRLLHVSSVAVYGPGVRYERITHEDVPLAPLQDRHWYARSKRDSEAVALEAHASGELWVTVIRPTVVYGRRDRQFVPRMARLIRRGIVAMPGDGRSTLPVVHAANVAHAGALALQSDRAGGRAYNVANDGGITLDEFLRLAAQGLGRRVRIVHVPRPIARLGVAGAQVALRAVGARGLAVMLDAGIDFVTRDNPFTSHRARSELGWQPLVEPEDGIPDAFRWYARHGVHGGVS